MLYLQTTTAGLIWTQDCLKKNLQVPAPPYELSHLDFNQFYNLIYYPKIFLFFSPSEGLPKWINIFYTIQCSLASMVDSSDGSADDSHPADAGSNLGAGSYENLIVS